MKKKDLFKIIVIVILLLFGSFTLNDESNAAESADTANAAQTQQDDKPDGSSRDKAYIYTIGSKATGKLEDSGKRYYKFTVEKNSCIQFDINTGSHYQSAKIVFMDDAGHNLKTDYTEDPNNWGYQIFSQEIAFARGEYYIVIADSYSGGDVSYSLRTSVTAEDSDQVRIGGLGNQYLKTAHPFVPGNTLQSVTLYDYSADCQRYRMTLDSDQTILMCAKAELTKGQKLTVRIYDADGNRISVKTQKKKDYVWSIKAEFKKGTYYIGVKGNANEIPYSIYTAASPKKITGVKASSTAKKTVKIKWKKSSAAGAGYEVQWCLRKDFRYSKVYKSTIKKTHTTALKKKGLKSKKKYYVRVCAYSTIDGKKIYGSWSKVKSVKIK